MQESRATKPMSAVPWREFESSVHPTVFVVEDDEAARHSVEALLSAMGYSVRSFASCEEFLKSAAEAAGNFLLLDYRFDGLNGLELLDRLKELNIFIPTILFTGVFDRSIKRRAQSYGEVVAILDKPVAARALRHALYSAAGMMRARAKTARGDSLRKAP